MWQEAVRLIKLAKFSSDDNDDDKCIVWTAVGPPWRETVPKGVHHVEILGTTWTRYNDSERTRPALMHITAEMQAVFATDEQAQFNSLRAQQRSLSPVLLHNVVAFMLTNHVKSKHSRLLEAHNSMHVSATLAARRGRLEDRGMGREGGGAVHAVDGPRAARSNMGNASAGLVKRRNQQDDSMVPVGLRARTTSPDDAGDAILCGFAPEAARRPP